MVNRMSRRAVLKAMGASPLAVVASSTLARGEDDAATRDAIGALWNPIYDGDLDEGMKKAAAHYKAKYHRDWPDVTRDKYQRIVQNLWTFFLLGVDHASPGMQPESGLLSTIFETRDANGERVTYSGSALVENLQFFIDPHDTTEKRTEVCAWRCGFGACQEELKERPNSTTVKATSYEAAWVPLSQEVAGVMARLNAMRRMAASSAGAC